MMDAQLRFDGKSKYCKYFDSLQEGSQLSQRLNIRTVNCCPPIGCLREVLGTILTIIITVNHNHISSHHRQYPPHHVTCVLTHRLSALTQYVAAQAMGVHTLHTLENQIRRQTFLLVPNTNLQLERYIWKET